MSGDFMPGLMQHLPMTVDKIIPLADDGRIALQRLEEHPDIDVILLDRMMPNMRTQLPFTFKIPDRVLTGSNISNCRRKGLSTLTAVASQPRARYPLTV
jgi:CheY-like chemotaxis protein